MSFINILVKKNLLTPEDGDSVLRLAKQTGRQIDEILADSGLKEEDVMTAKAEYFGLPVRKMDGKSISFNILKYVPEESAMHYGLIPIGLADGVLEVGIIDPDNIEARDALNFIAAKAGLPFKIFVISPNDFSQAIKSYRGVVGDVSKAVEEFQSSEKNNSKADDLNFVIDISPKESDGTRVLEDAPLKKMVTSILLQAVEGEASDIHIEPGRTMTMVRYRQDGELHSSLWIPRSSHNGIASIIKNLCNMKLDEKRRPQDGRFSANFAGRTVDFRVSTFPSYFGEKVVLRILDQARGVKKLEEMVTEKEVIDLIRWAVSRPYGLILISGPTGSGKTTTLYSMLNEIDKEKNNVVSLEDPIEYNMDGVSQSQVMPDIGYTFANGLRTILRQDPNVIMVGEIRDGETAQLAVQAALTGHLVFATIHTNTSVGVIPRLVDMGVDPYLIAPTLVLSMGQRLVKKLVPGTGLEVPFGGIVEAEVNRSFSDLPEEFRKNIKMPTKVYKVDDTTPETIMQSTSGRAAVFEAFKMTREVETLILKNPSEATIFDSLRKKGMLTMAERAMIKAFNGEIPWEEVDRIRGANDDI
ncbi:MAG: GspE/PulE family protein [bacterium]